MWIKFNWLTTNSNGAIHFLREHVISLLAVELPRNALYGAFC
jgi:hypothetical protein